jgi:hypothetical protein
MIYYPGDFTTYTFTGNLNTGDISIPVVGHSGAVTYTYNLIPNPYPSAINWAASSSGWILPNGTGGTCYIWSATGGNYISLSNAGNAFIPAGQSFLVMIQDANNSYLAIKNAARVHSDQSFYKSREIAENHLKIAASSNSYYDETVIGFEAGTTSGFDLQLDGMKLAGLADAPQLCTRSGDFKFSINILPLANNEVVVPLDFETQYSGEVTFTASGMESFNPLTTLYLEDKTLNKMVNLRTEPVYTFSYQSGSAADRFVLHFNGVTGIKEFTTIQGKAFLSNGRICLDVPSMQGHPAVITVYDMLGQVIRSQEKVMDGIISIEAPLAQGVFVVSVTSEGRSFVTKIINK